MSSARFSPQGTRLSAGGNTRLSPGGTNLFGTTTAYQPRSATLSPATTATNAELARQEQLRLARNARAKIAREAKKAASGVVHKKRGGGGGKRKPLIQRLNAANAKGKVLDVSKHSSGGAIKLLKFPSIMKTKFGVLTDHFGLQPIMIVSDNLQSYRQALNELGVDANAYDAAYERVRAGEGRPMVPKLASSPRRRTAQPKSPSEKKANQARDALVARANKKSREGKQLSDVEKAALASAVARKEAKQAQSAAKKAQQARAKVLKKAGVASPTSKSALNNINNVRLSGRPSSPSLSSRPLSSFDL